MDTWTFTVDDYFPSVGLDSTTSAELQSRADLFVEATLRLSPEWDIHRASSGPTQTYASAPLHIPGTRYHISLTKALKTAWHTAMRVAALAVLLHQKGLLDLSINISVNALASLFAQITALTPEQRIVVDGIVSLKKASGSPVYWPTKDELATQTGFPAAEISDLLASLSGKVVEYVPHCEGWRVLF